MQADIPEQSKLDPVHHLWVIAEFDRCYDKGRRDEREGLSYDLWQSYLRGLRHMVAILLVAAVIATLFTQK